MSKFSHLSVSVVNIIERGKPTPDSIVIVCKVEKAVNYPDEFINIEFTPQKRILSLKFKQSRDKNFTMEINVSRYDYKINGVDYVKYYCDSVDKSAPPPY